MARPPDPRRTAELLDACCAVVERRGVGVTLRPLAAEVGVSARTLLYQFGSRDNLMQAVLRRSRERHLALITELQRTTLAPGETSDVAAAARSLWQASTTPEARPFLLLFFEVHALAARDRERYRDFIDEAVAGWREQLARVLSQEGSLSDGEAAGAASALIAVHRGLLLEWLVTGERERLGVAHAEAVDRLLRR